MATLRFYRGDFYLDQICYPSLIFQAPGSNVCLNLGSIYFGIGHQEVQLFCFNLGVFPIVLELDFQNVI
jgi:hypothetical protein